MDMAAASLFVMNLPKLTYDTHTHPMLSHINVGYGSDVSIRELAEMIGKTVGYNGKINFDSSKPDGSPQKLMDSSLLSALGWKATVKLEDGLRLAYRDFCKTFVDRK
jgi:GDP-L-fucose synthase